MINHSLLTALPYDLAELDAPDLALLGLAALVLGPMFALLFFHGPPASCQESPAQEPDLHEAPVPVPAMGGWRIDVKFASFHLVSDGHTEAAGLRLLGDAESSTAWSNREAADAFDPCEYPADVGFAIPLDEVDHVLAAIEQVHASSGWKAWRDDPLARRDAGFASYFRTELVDGWVHIHGPMIIHDHGAPWRPASAVELEYRYLPWLPGTLIAARANATPVCPGCELALPCQSCRGSGDNCKSISRREQEPYCAACGGTGLCSQCEIEGVAASRAWADTVRDTYRRPA
ncbi:hypothetical protein AB0A63_13835 [Lentzea sp. NPDC042327]|uniref:hypothetical protein n=1 Tax=Lentzea sp. NPDC042327 TaxID=3154801 RepID=UPI0033F028DE